MFCFTLLLFLFSDLDSEITSCVPQTQREEEKIEVVVYDIKPERQKIQQIFERNKKSRKIKLFVSSTFRFVPKTKKLFKHVIIDTKICYDQWRDMQEERNLLVKNIFPELKRICAQRNVTFVYIGELAKWFCF